MRKKVALSKQESDNENAIELIISLYERFNLKNKRIKRLRYK